MNNDDLTVPGRNELDYFTGTSVFDAVGQGDRREAVRACLAQLDANYNGGVDYQLAAGQTLLCSETAALLYDRFTARETRYRHGMWPQLEAAVAHAVVLVRRRVDAARAILVGVGISSDVVVASHPAPLPRSIRV